MGKLDITISTQEPKYKKQDTFFVFESSSKEISLNIIFWRGDSIPTAMSTHIGVLQTNSFMYKLPSSVQVQSKFSPVGTEISLKFNYYHPPTPWKIEMQLEIGPIWTVGSW